MQDAKYLEINGIAYNVGYSSNDYNDSEKSKVEDLANYKSISQNKIELLENLIGGTSVKFYQGGIDAEGNEDSSDYWVRSVMLSNFELLVNSGYNIAYIAIYNLDGSFRNRLSVGANPLIQEDPNSFYKVVIFKGNQPDKNIIRPSENIVADFKSGIYKTFDTIIEGDVDNEKSARHAAQQVATSLISKLPDEEDLTIELDGQTLVMKFANRSALVKNNKVNSLGYVILRKDKSFAEQVVDANTIYEIRYEVDINGGTVEIPANCTLKFNGGKIANGTIIGGETVIDATITQIFDNITLDGTWNVKEAVPEWFGVCGVYKTDDSENIEFAAKLAICNSSKQGVLKLNNKYYVSKPIFIDKGVSVVGVTSQTTDITKIQLLANPNFTPVEHNGLMITSLLWMQGYADVRNLSLQGRNDIWCSGIYVINSTAQGRIIDCMFSRFTLMGIYLKGSEDFIIDKVRMTACGISVKATAFNNTDTLSSDDYYGIYNFFSGTSKVYSVNLLKITNCYMLYSNVHICVEGGYDVAIQNTCTSRASIAGVVFYRVTSSNIVGNYTEEDAIAGWFYEKNTTESFFTWGDDVTDRTVSQSLIDKGLNGFAVTNNTDSRVRAWIVLSGCQRLSISRNSISYRKRGKLRDNSVNLTSHDLLGSDATIFAIGCRKINIVDNNYYQPVSDNSTEERYRRIKEVIFDANSANRFIYQRSNYVNDGNNSWIGWGTFLQDYRIEGLSTDDINKRTLVQFANDSFKPFPANHEIGFIDNKGLSLFKFNEKAQFGGTRFPISVFGDDICVLKAKCLNPNKERFIGTFTMQWRDTAGKVIASSTYSDLTKVDTENEDTNIYSIGIAFCPKLYTDAATINFSFLQAAADESVALSCPFFESNGLPYDDYGCNLQGFPRTPIANKLYKTQSKSYLYNGTEWIDSEDRKVNVSDTSQPMGMGYKILIPNLPFASQVTAPNTIYEIRYRFDVGGTTDKPVIMPANSILRFTGGRLDKGVIRMTRGTKIDAGAVTIFGRELTILYPWLTTDASSHLYPEWYDGTDQERLQWAIDLVAGTAENLNRGESPIIWLTENYTLTEELRCYPKDIDFPNKVGTYRTFINIEGSDASRSIIYIKKGAALENKPIFNCTGMNRSSFKNFRIHCYPTDGYLPHCAFFVCRKADNHNAGNNMFERVQIEGNFAGQSVALVGSESNMFLECSANYYLHNHIPSGITSNYYMPTVDTVVSGGTTRNIFIGGGSNKIVIGSDTNSTLFVGGYSYNNGLEFIADTAEIDFINFRQEGDSNIISGVTVKEGVTINNINFWGGNLMGIVGEKGSTIQDCNFSAKTSSMNINNYNAAYSEKYQDSPEYLITSEDRTVCVVADNVVNCKFNPWGGTVKIINPVYNEILGTNGGSIGDSIYRTMTPLTKYIPGVITNGVYDKPIWDFYKQLKVGVLGFDYEIIEHTTVSKLNLNFAKPSVKIVNLSANVNGLNVSNNLSIHDKRNTMVLIHFVQDSVGGRNVYEFYNNDITRKLDIDPRPNAVTSVLIYHTTSPLKNYIIPLNYKNISTTDEINSYKDKIKNFKGYKVYNSDTGTYCYAGKEGLREIMSIPYGVKTTGITDERPKGISAGFQYFDTTLSKPIWWNGTVWVDSTGTEV